MLPYRGGVVLHASSGGEGILMIHSAGSVTTQSMAFRYVMTSEPYKYT
jgi:hypothetical protein